MKKTVKTAALVTAAVLFLLTGVVFAAADRTPGDIVSELTGKTQEELEQGKGEGKTFGALAKEAGKLEEFKIQMLEQKRDILDRRLEEGIITPAQKEEIYNTLKENLKNCDGTGPKGWGEKQGVCFGQGKGKGWGRGLRMGRNG